MAKLSAFLPKGEFYFPLASSTWSDVIRTPINSPPPESLIEILELYMAGGLPPGVTPGDALLVCVTSWLARQSALHPMPHDPDWLHALASLLPMGPPGAPDAQKVDAARRLLQFDAAVLHSAANLERAITLLQAAAHRSPRSRSLDPTAYDRIKKILEADGVWEAPLEDVGWDGQFHGTTKRLLDDGFALAHASAAAPLPKARFQVLCKPMPSERVYARLTLTDSVYTATGTVVSPKLGSIVGALTMQVEPDPGAGAMSQKIKVRTWSYAVLYTSPITWFDSNEDSFTHP